MLQVNAQEATFGEGNMSIAELSYGPKTSPAEVKGSDVLETRTDLQLELRDNAIKKNSREKIIDVG